VSSSTHAAVITPGKAVAVRAREILAELRAQSGSGLTQRASTLGQQRVAADGSTSSRLAHTGTRADAAAGMRRASPLQRRSSASALGRTGHERAATPERDTTRAPAAGAEQDLTRIAEQRAVLEFAAAHLQGSEALTAEDFTRDANGVMHLSTPMSTGGRVSIAVLESEAGGHQLLIDTAASGIDTLVTDRGVLVGCDAQEELIAKAGAAMRAAGSEVTVIPAWATPLAAARPAEAQAERS
jgi:hypothetical protein